MKKTFKFKRWMAFALAVILIATTCIGSSDAFLRATGNDVEATAPMDSTVTVDLTGSDSAAQPAEAVPVTPEEITPPEETQPAVPEVTAPVEPLPEVTAPVEPVPDSTVSAEPAESDADVLDTTTPELTAPDATTPAEPSAEETEAEVMTPAESDAVTAYGYDIYFYYGDTVGNHIEGSGALGELILSPDRVTVEKATVEYEGQSYSYVTTENEEGRITENKEANVVNVRYALVSASNEQPKEETPEENGELSVEETYTLSFANDSNKGSVEIVSASSEAVAENTYKKDTEVTFTVTAKEGFKPLSAKVQGGSELTGKSEQSGVSAYTVTMAGNMVIEVSYEETESLKKPVNASAFTSKKNQEYTVTVIFHFKDNEGSMYDSQETFSTSADYIDGMSLQNGKYQYRNGHICVSYAFEDGIYREGSCMYFGLDMEKKPIDKTEYTVDLYYDRCASLIQFETNEGSSVSPISGEAGEKIENRQMPKTERPGFIFDGWYADAGFEGQPVTELPEQYPEGTVTYYAKWIQEKSEAKYTVYYLDADTESKIDGFDPVENSEKIGSPIDAVKFQKTIEGYSFQKANPSTLVIDEDESKNIIRLYYKKEAAEPKVKIWKEADKSQYSVGETIHYSVYVENTGGCDLENVTLTDSMWSEAGGLGQRELSFGTLKRAENKTQTYEYVVQQSDAGKNIGNKVELTDSSIAIEAGSKLECKVGVNDGKAALVLYKQAISTPKDETGYVLGEEIIYEIIAKNTGDLTLTNTVIKDSLTGDEWTIDKLEPGAEQSFKTQPYKVTAVDVSNGSVSNTVNATSKGSDGKDAEITPATEVVSTVTKQPSLFVQKKVVEDEPGKVYKLGDKVIYKIGVWNNGDVRIEHIGVKDTETGGVWEVDALDPGQSRWFDTNYQVKEEDVAAGSFTNTVYVTGTDKNGVRVETSAQAVITTVAVKSHLTVNKKTVSKPANGKAYVLGEKITYEIVVTNDGNQTVKDVIVKDDLTGDYWELGTLAPNQSVEKVTSYTVQEKDIKAGKVVNVATAAGCSPDSTNNPTEITPGKTEDNTEKTQADLSIEKKAVENTSGKVYELNEVVDYTVTVKNTGNVTMNDIELKDVLTKEVWSLKSLAPGESHSFTTQYRVTEADVLQGTVVNQANVSGKSADGELVYKETTETIKTGNKKAHLTIKKTVTSQPANGSTYALGETITYKIGIVNDGNVTLRNVVVEDPLTGAKWNIEELKPGYGNSIPMTTSYKVTAADVAAGKVVNVATASGQDPDNNQPEVTPGEEVVYTVTGDALLLLKKEAVGNDAGRTYRLGEEVKYIITVTNAGNVVINDIDVKDELTGAAWTVKSLKPNESKEFTTKYTVQEKDVIEGGVVNKVNASGKPANGGDVNEEATEKITTVGTDGHLTLVKTTTSKPANGIAYALGETITYEIIAKNDGNLTLTDVRVEDPLTKGEWDIKEIKPGQTSTVMSTSYQVTEADIINGSVVNEAIVTSATTPDPKNPMPEVTEGRTEDKTGDGTRMLIISKEVTNTPANGKAYALGETITYEIRAENKGNLTLTDIEVKDELTGKAWAIDEIKPGQRSAAMITSYVVQEEDILRGRVVNVATAKEQNPATDKPDLEVEEGKAEAPTDADHPSLYAEKIVDGKESGYTLGEEVKYTIRVKNTGNVTIKDIVVTDDLTRETWKIDHLATDGKDEIFVATHIVTEDDIKTGKIVNVVTISGTDPEGNPVGTTAEETVTTVPLQETMSVVKTVMDPKEQYNVGDTIRYQIAVTNTGNVTLHNVKVTDTLTGTTGKVTFTDLAGGTLSENGDVVFSELRIGATANIRCEYKVERGDAASSIGNRVEATSDEIDTPVPDATPDTPVEKLYKLIIHYVYATGGTAAPDYVGEYLEGESFGPIYSPTVSGYNPNASFVRTGHNGMPAGMPNDVLEITITYRAASNPGPTDPTDPTPTPGPTDPTPTPGSTDPTPTPGPTDPTPTPGTTDPTPTPGTTDPVPTGTLPVNQAPTPAPTAVVPTAPVAAGDGAVLTLTPPADLETVVDGEIPGAAIDLDDDGDPVLTTVTDERVPLTNRELDDGHKCCIMSFLLMLATLIIYTCFTHSMKKRQKKLAELKDQLEEERLKRELGITDNWQEKRLGA